MLKYDGANAFRLIRSKIGLKIGVLVVIQIIFIVTSFSILSYYESQGTYLGNSINIAGKNRFLTSNLMLHMSEYFMESSSSDVSRVNHVSKINSAVLNIAVAAIVLFFVMKILKPIFALTTATSEISRGNLDISIKSTGNDELSVLSRSFNSMVNSLNNSVKKQSELTKELKNANEELKHKDQLKDEFINVAAHELRSPIQPILALS